MKIKIIDNDLREFDITCDDSIIYYILESALEYNLIDDFVIFDDDEKHNEPSDLKIISPVYFNSSKTPCIFEKLE